MNRKLESSKMSNNMRKMSLPPPNQKELRNMSQFTSGRDSSQVDYYEGSSVSNYGGGGSPRGKKGHKLTFITGHEHDLSKASLIMGAKPRGSETLSGYQAAVIQMVV